MVYPFDPFFYYKYNIAFLRFKGQTHVCLLPKPANNIQVITRIARYRISSVILKMGIKRAMTMPPMTIPKKPITTGSIMEVRPDTAASTCSS
jgi:hypothetical protein